MEIVGAAFGYESDLTAGGASLIGIVPGGGDAKFLDGVERRAYRASEGGAADLVVVVHAVEGDVGLVAAASIDGAVARIHVVIDVGSDECSAGLQAQHSRGITALEGQRQDLTRIKGVAERGVSGIHRRQRAFRDGNGIRDGA